MEQIVASFLGIDRFPGAWNYFDLKDATGRTISVKQSVGEKARFDVSGRRNAWDQALAEERRRENPQAEGWLENEAGAPRRWCDIFVYAHLASPLTVERVHDVDEWRFAVASRATLDGLPEGTRAVSVPRLEQLGCTFAHGSQLPDAIDAADPR